MFCRLLISTLVVAIAAGDLENEPERFLISPITKTVTSTTTVFTSSPVTSYCASMPNSTLTACRRKRDLHEKPIISFSDDNIENIVPSLLLAMEPTTVPLQKSYKREAAVAPNSAQIASSKSEMSVEFKNLDSICQTQQQGRFFGLLNPANIGITVYYTTTATVTVTSTTAGATTFKPFTIQGCTPSPFTYPVCIV